MPEPQSRIRCLPPFCVVIDHRVLSAVVLSATIACDGGAADASADTRLLRRADFGATWPFTVDSLRVACLAGSKAVAYHGGSTYALNGTAKSWGYAAIEPIWLFRPDVPELRINIGPAIDAALALCDPPVLGGESGVETPPRPGATRAEQSARAVPRAREGRTEHR
jgi:hypothetical protein